ncbi:MAG: hypothetical protein ACTS22_04065 [Phycisphaerales bacterium]
MSNRREGGRAFTAELDICDLDDRLRPGPRWIVRSRVISRGHIVVHSRRMCYHGSRVALGVHMVDAEPLVLVGIVSHCEYESDGRYRIEIEFENITDQGLIGMLRQWFIDASAA